MNYHKTYQNEPEVPLGKYDNMKESSKRNIGIGSLIGHKIVNDSIDLDSSKRYSRCDMLFKQYIICLKTPDHECEEYEKSIKLNKCM